METIQYAITLVCFLSIYSTFEVVLINIVINKTNINFLIKIVLNRQFLIFYLFIILLLFSHILYAQKSSKNGVLKGIDLKMGSSIFNLSNNDAASIYSAIVLPDLEKQGIQVKGFENGEAYNFCSSIYLGLVTTNNKILKSKYFKKTENRFGLVYGSFNHFSGMVNCDVLFSNDTTRNLIKGIIRYI